MKKLMTRLVLILAVAPLAGCVVYADHPHHPHAYWVPGHYGPYGGWNPGHWQ